MIIAIVGSGGKTTLLKRMAEDYRNQGKRVFATTTTHMFLEDGMVLSDNADTILAALDQTGYVLAGIPYGEKIRALSKETFEKVCQSADVVLVEADGSRHMPLKFPNDREPVIPAGAEQIIVVWGPHGLGRPAREVCHRPELVTRCLGITEDTPVTEEHVRVLLQRGYLIPLRRQYPNAKITVYPKLP